jgi:hypothetical protein
MLDESVAGLLARPVRTALTGPVMPSSTVLMQNGAMTVRATLAGRR